MPTDTHKDNPENPLKAPERVPYPAVRSLRAPGARGPAFPLSPRCPRGLNDLGSLGRRRPLGTMLENAPGQTPGTRGHRRPGPLPAPGVPFVPASRVGQSLCAPHPEREPSQRTRKPHGFGKRGWNLGPERRRIPCPAGFSARSRP